MATGKAHAADDGYRRGAARPPRAWDPEHEDVARPTLEVNVTWGDTRLFALHRTPPTDFVVGEEADLAVPPELLGTRRRRLVRVVAGEVRAVIFDGARGRLDLDEADLAFDDARAMRRERALDEHEWEVRLPLGRSATFELGELRIELAHVAAARRPRRSAFRGEDGTRRPPWPLLSLLSSLLLHAGLVAALVHQTRPEVHPEAEGLDRETAAYMLELAVHAGDSAPIDSVPRFGNPQSCISLPFPPAAYDHSLERRHMFAVVARSEPLSALGSAWWASLPCGPRGGGHAFAAACWPTTVHGGLARALRRVELLSPAEDAARWGTPLPLGPVDARSKPAATATEAEELLTRLAGFRVRLGAFEGAPEMVRVARANADVLRGCVLDALDAGAPPSSLLVELTATEGEVSAVQLKGGDEAAPCLREALGRLAFPRSTEAAVRRVKFTAEGGPAEEPPHYSESADGFAPFAAPMATGPGE